MYIIIEKEVQVKKNHPHDGLFMLLVCSFIFPLVHLTFTDMVYNLNKKNNYDCFILGTKVACDLEIYVISLI